MTHAMVATPPQVLVVDDEPEVRRLTVRALSSVGLTCDQAADGHAALEKLTSSKYDAVLTDLRMPQKHGHALCNDLLQMPGSPPVMVITALTDARLVRDLMGRGVYDVLQKPVRYDVLAQKVVAMLRNARPLIAAPAPTPKKNVPSAKINFLKGVEKTLKELTELFGDRLDTAFEGQLDGLPDPPRAVRDVIRRLAEAEATTLGETASGFVPAHEARKQERATCYTTAIAVPVDRHWDRNGEPFKLSVRDISEGGLRMLHTRATNAHFLALTWRATQLPSTQFRVVAKIMRCSPVSPFYDIGGMFVMAD